MSGNPWIASAGPYCVVQSMDSLNPCLACTCICIVSGNSFNTTDIHIRIYMYMRTCTHIPVHVRIY